MATNIINNEMYIGQTVNTMNKRIGTHKLDLKRNKDYKFYRAIKKYGWDNFKWKVLYHNIENDMLDVAEICAIYVYDTYHNGYNSTEGGDVNPMLGKKHTDESKKKIITALTGRQCSVETRAKMRKSASNRRHSEQTLQKISDNHADISGINNPMYGKNVYDIWIDKYGKEEADKRYKLRGEKISKSLKNKMTGENGPTAKLNNNDVSEIREKYKSGKYTQKFLAKEYGISTGNISLILNYKTWK